jgi:hypothetical protein
MSVATTRQPCCRKTAVELPLEPTPTSRTVGVIPAARQRSRAAAKIGSMTVCNASSMPASSFLVAVSVS